MDIKNLTGLEKPLTKLIEVISKGTGVLYEPTRIKREALAEAESLKIKSDAVVEVLEKHGKAGALALVCEKEKLEFKDVSELSDRLIESKSYQERLEQRNVENVIASSIEYMGDQVTDEEVDIDWRTRFFKKAKEVSHEDMQKVWGKILAGEVANPGSYSMRSLELLSNLTQQEAELFRKFSGYVELSSGYVFVPHNKVRQVGLNDEFSYGVLLKLEDCGLLMSQHDLGFNIDFQPSSTTGFHYKKGAVTFFNETKNKVTHRMSILSLSNSGKELLNLVESNSWDGNYFKMLQGRYSSLKLTYHPSP